MRIVVTGGTGNLGTAVVRRLVAGGHDVVGLARRVPQPAAATPDWMRQVSWGRVDLTAADRERELAGWFRGADAVVHTAWGFQPTRDPAHLYQLDVGGTYAVLRACGRAAVPHLVHVSSVGAYSPRTGNDPVDESWPTGGIGRLPYSVDKSRAERLLDEHEAVAGHLPAVARVRPSLMARRDVGAALARYTLPSLLPTSLLRQVPVVPLPPAFWVQLTHTDDVADGVAEVVERRAAGAFNLTTEQVCRRSDVAEALGARAVDFPWPVLRAAAAAAWCARLQPVDPGWLDMAAAVPRMSAARAGRELGWAPRRSGPETLRETIRGIQDAAGFATPALRPRRLGEQLRHLVRGGPVSRRPIA